MRIEAIETRSRRLPLRKVFRTAIHEVREIVEIGVRVISDTGLVGIGAACPTERITGDTAVGIEEAIEHHLAPCLVGLPIPPLEPALERLHQAMVHNTSAKAALDMALYDLLAKHWQVPLYQLLGGSREMLKTDLTLSLDELEVMVREALAAQKEGFETLKIKVGHPDGQDLRRVAEIRAQVGPAVKLRLDANQAWQPKEAVRLIRQLEEYDLEFIEQPVRAMDWEGLRWVTQHVDTPIMADESLFSPHDAWQLLSQHIVDWVNIKLMKCGGLSQALRIIAIAEATDTPCMIGSMMESTISVSAASHLAAARRSVTLIDLDAPLFLAPDGLSAGIHYEGPIIRFAQTPGLGLDDLP